MKYSDFLRTVDGFQYSINLQYDLDNHNKIKGYIPTANTINILKEYVKNIYNGNGDNSSVLIGPYGKGKSHLLLILLTMIHAKQTNRIVLDELISKIDIIDSEAAQLCRLLVEQKRKLLPVIISGDYSNLQQAFLIALNDALQKNGLVDIMPKTYFQSVTNLICKWKNEYKDTVNMLQVELQKINLTLDELEKRLSMYDNEAFDIFKKVYEVISSGVEYNALVNSDVVKLYDETNYLLCEKYGYSGVFIVFDEFSKFIESSVTQNTIRDLKMLQDFAEISNRSSVKQQMNLVCVNHKTINEYIYKLPHDVINSWRAIEARFKEFYLTSSSTQNYELISNAVIKDYDKLEEFIEPYKNTYYEKIDKAVEIFTDTYSEEKFKENIGLNCFPLNPTVVYTLPKISEKVAQNERTLFTFLCKNERYTLSEFIEKNTGSIELLNINMLYDYFSDLFKKETFNNNVHDIWVKADTALRKCNDSLEEDIIKAIAVIYICDDMDKLAPTSDMIAVTLTEQETHIEEKLQSLKDRNLIYIKKNNGHINFTPITDINIRQKIDVIKNTRVKNEEAYKELDLVSNLGYVLPKKYNDDFKMVRYFKNIYMTVAMLNSFVDAETMIKFYDADGVVLHLIYEDNEQKKLAIDKIKELKDVRVVALIPKKPFDKLDALKGIAAINSIKNDVEFVTNEPLANELLEILEEDLIDDVKVYLNQYFTVNGEFSGFIIDGEVQNIKRKSELNKRISEICNIYFSRTPIINNEMINKNNLTTVMLKARNKLVNAIIDKDIESIALVGTSPESTLFRATIKKFGLDEDKRSKHDENINNILNEIDKFIKACEKQKTSFAMLYDVLTGKDIGMRKGIIPIYLALIMQNYKNDLTISYGSRNSKELELNADTVNNINYSPHEYYLSIEKGTEEKENLCGRVT